MAKKDEKVKLKSREDFQNAVAERFENDIDRILLRAEAEWNSRGPVEGELCSFFYWPAGGCVPPPPEACEIACERLTVALAEAGFPNLRVVYRPRRWFSDYVKFYVQEKCSEERMYG